MTVKFSGVFLFLLAAVLFLAIFTFFSAYMTCLNAHNDLQRARVELIEQSEQLGSLSVRMGALALKYLPNGRSITKQMEPALERMREQRSVSDMAEACRKLCALMKKINRSLKGHNKAKDDYRFRDASRSFGEVGHRLSLAGKRYNQVAKQYNETLLKPLPHFWRLVLDSRPAELFAARKKKS